MLKIKVLHGLSLILPTFKEHLFQATLFDGFFGLSQRKLKFTINYYLFELFEMLLRTN